MTVENVNLIKLTKLEKKVLTAIAKGHPNAESEYKWAPKIIYHNYPKGNSTFRIAEIVFGSEVLKPYDNLSLPYAVKSSLSRLLKKLWKKGLVKKCKPYYRYVWNKAEPNDEFGGVGYYGKSRQLSYLSARWIDEHGQIIDEHLSFGNYGQLPNRCRVWWMLTDKGLNVTKTIKFEEG